MHHVHNYHFSILKMHYDSRFPFRQESCFRNSTTRLVLKLLFVLVTSGSFVFRLFTILLLKWLYVLGDHILRALQVPDVKLGSAENSSPQLTTLASRSFPE